MSFKIPSIYAITDRRVAGVPDHAEIARRLLAVGVRLIQIRDKELPDRELLAAVEETAALARPCRATILVNDRVDIARVAGVGVHLGDEDLPPEAARALLPEGAIIGVSTHDLEAARRAFAEGIADYVAFGPVFASTTKSVVPPRGLDGLVQAARARTRPLVAVGGITADRVEAVLESGADSAAMIAGLLADGRIEEQARRAVDLARRRVPLGRVYLVGFMGSGKTVIGSRIAQRLGVPFVDLDAEIERTSGLTVRALFEASGETAFRERETAFLEGTRSLPQVIVATGGGCYAREENRRVIAGLGTAAFLDVPFATILSRLSGKTDRPLFQNDEQALALSRDRDPFYRMAPVHVTLAAGSIEEAADQVLNTLFDRLDARGL